MAIYDIIMYPDRRLETLCEAVTEFDTTDLHQLVADLFETMYYHEGLGLAAPQIGILKRVAVVDPSSGRDPKARVALINPMIAEARGRQRGEEGCLSFPGFTEMVTRSMNIVVEAKVPVGETVHLQCEGLLSRALQHEIDHLDGILFLRRMSPLTRELFHRRTRKKRRTVDHSAVRGS